jgi:hypothetical protein
MVPAPASSIPAKTARVVRTAARKVRVSEPNQSSSVTDRKPSRRGVTAPTLFTRMSTGPSSSAAATRSPGPETLERSTLTAYTRPSWVSSASSVVVLRAPATTWTPSSRNARVIARPRPLLAPVTSAFLPVRPRSMFATLRCEPAKPPTVVRRGGDAADHSAARQPLPRPTAPHRQSVALGGVRPAGELPHTNGDLVLREPEPSVPKGRPIARVPERRRTLSPDGALMIDIHDVGRGASDLVVRDHDDSVACYLRAPRSSRALCAWSCWTLTS